MKELGITKGEWQHFKFAKGNVEANGRSVANCMGYSNNTDAGKHIEENYANAELVIDAGNTAQKCGLLPSELLQQRDELKEENEKLKRQIQSYNPYPNRPNPQDVNPYDIGSVKRARRGR